MGQAAQEAIIRIEALCGFVFRPFDFGLIELWRNCTDHFGGDLILKLEDVLQCFIESVGPDMRAILAIYELAGNADLGCGFSHAPFQHVAHTELASYLPDVRRAILVGKARTAGDYEQRLE